MKRPDLTPEQIAELRRKLETLSGSPEAERERMYVMGQLLAHESPAFAAIWRNPRPNLKPHPKWKAKSSE